MGIFCIIWREQWDVMGWDEISTGASLVRLLTDGHSYGLHSDRRRERAHAGNGLYIDIVDLFLGLGGVAGGGFVLCVSIPMTLDIHTYIHNSFE